MGRWIRVDHVFRENAILLWGFNGLRKNHHSVTLGNTHQTTSKSQWMQRNIRMYCIQTGMYANDIFMNWNQHYICATICLSKHHICPDSLARISGVWVGGIAQRYSLRYFEAWNYPMPAMVTRLTLPALVWRLACVRAPKVYPSVGIMWYQTSWPVMQLNWELHYMIYAVNIWCFCIVSHLLTI